MQPLKIISRPTEVFLETGVLKICSKFTGGHPRHGHKVTLLKLQFGMGLL